MCINPEARPYGPDIEDNLKKNKISWTRFLVHQVKNDVRILKKVIFLDLRKQGAAFYHKTRNISKGKIKEEQSV